MAANHDNTPLHLQITSAQQSHLTALLAALQTANLQAKMTANDRRRAFREATADLCEVTTSSACVGDPMIGVLKEFHHFSKLPTELRLQIWRHAINAPRVIEFRNWIGRNDVFSNIPPASILACRESHEEVTQTYKPYHDAEPTQGVNCRPSLLRWLRLDIDIIHFKPISGMPDLSCLSEIFAKPGHTLPIRQHSRLNSQVNLSTDKWLRRPAHFGQIKTLAISRDILVHLPDDCEPFIRHFFPNLLVLIVLIDDEIDIDEEWGVHDLDYSRYDKPLLQKTLPTFSISNPYNIPRFDFAQKCTAPFKEVKLNVDYRMDIEFEMRKRFEKEEEIFHSYTAPRIQVLGAFVPQGVHVEECGRLPVKSMGDRKKKYNTNPFGDFANEDDSTISWD